MNFLPSIRIHIFLLLMFISNTLVQAQASVRILELSTRGIPLNGSIRFLNSNQEAIGEVISINAERFVWKVVPEDAKKIEIISLSVAEAVDLSESGNTLIAINPIRSIDPESVEKGEFKRLPLIHRISNVMPLEAGVQGWVFLGGLDADSDLAEWRSLYILNAGDHTKPDRNVHLTYEKFRARINSGDDVGKLYVADFPLNLRNTPGGREATNRVVRAGQRLRIASIERLGNEVYGRVTVE
jgi:hypothetical protein